MKKIILLFFLSSCISNKAEWSSRFGQDTSENAQIKTTCQEIEKTGDIFSLLEEIKFLTNDILQIIDSDHPENQYNEVARLSAEVHSRTKKVLQLSQSEWTHAKWNYQVSWLINRFDFKKSLGTHLPNGFELIGADIQDLYFQGEKRADLKEKLKISLVEQEFIVEYENIGSSLELCQLYKTMMIVIAINYRNLNGYKTRYFNLYLNE